MTNAEAFESRQARPSADAPVVTVVIPFRNGGRRLQDVLEALAQQTLPRDSFEVIVGDDGSQEEIPQGKGRLNLTVTRDVPRNSYVARNRAARVGSAEILAFCDADCVPAPGWLEAGIEALESADVVVGDICWDPPAKPSLWTLLDIDLHVDPAAAVRSGRCLGGNLFVRRALFDQIGGFDESLASGGDDDFGSRCMRAGARPLHAPGARVAHPTHDRGKPFLKKIWRVNFATGVREGRSGHRARLLTPWLVPTVGMIRSRRATGRPLSPDPKRLAAAGVNADPPTRLMAIAALYFAVPYVARAARASGHRAGRREAESAS